MFGLGAVDYGGGGDQEAFPLKELSELPGEFCRVEATCGSNSAKKGDDSKILKRFARNERQG